MSELIVQSAVGSSSFPIPGGNFGPGTRGMSTVSAIFPQPLTSGNVVLVAISGNMPSIGANVDLGPPPSIAQGVGPGIGDPVAFKYAYSLVSDQQTEMGAIAIGFAKAGQKVVASPPNLNSLSSPGWFGWNFYMENPLGSGIMRQQNLLGPIGPTTDFTVSALQAGPLPETTPMHDTLGLSYTQAIFLGGGGVVGVQAMGFYFADIIVGGTDTISFYCSAFNGNPLFGVVCDLDMIICELTPGAANNFLDSAFVQQGPAIFDVQLNLTDSSGITRTTDYDTQAQSSEAAAVISPGTGIDYFMALMTGFFGASPGPPNIPPTITGLTYVPVNNVTSYNGLQLHMWVTYRNVVTPSTGGFYVRES